MKWLRQSILCVVVASVPAVGLLLAHAGPQDSGKPQMAIDPQTGRALEAKEMAPDELRKLIDQKAKMIIIDVRDEAQFQKETIKGAIYIPFAELEGRLKEIPKDTILVFT
jgi:3-mercaptopyruvate sulfurtransferase SseA